MKLSSRQELLAEAEVEIKKMQKTLAKKRKLKESRTNLKEAVLHEGAWKYTRGHGDERGYKYKKTIGQAIQNSWWLSLLKYVTGTNAGMKPSDIPRISHISATIWTKRDDYGGPITAKTYDIEIGFNTGMVKGSPSGPKSYIPDSLIISGDLLMDTKPSIKFYVGGTKESKPNSKLIQWANTPDGKSKMDALANTLVDELKRDTEVATTYESKVPNRKARTNEANTISLNESSVGFESTEAAYKEYQQYIAKATSLKSKITKAFQKEASKYLTGRWDLIVTSPDPSWSDKVQASHGKAHNMYNAKFREISLSYVMRSGKLVPQIYFIGSGDNMSGDGTFDVSDVKLYKAYQSPQGAKFKKGH